MYVFNINLSTFELVSGTVLRNVKYSKKPARAQLAGRFESFVVEISLVTTCLERSSSVGFCLSDVLVRSSLKE